MIKVKSLHWDKKSHFYQNTLLMEVLSVRPDPGAVMSHPSSLPTLITKGSSQIPGTNDSILHQLKPPHPSHVEGPVSPRRLGLATYPNPCPSSLTIPRNQRIKTTPNTVQARTSSTCRVRVLESHRERFAIKSLLDTLLVSWSSLPNIWRPTWGPR